LADTDHDGLAAVLEYALGSSDQTPNSAGIMVATEVLTVGGVSAVYATATVPLSAGADSATVTAELSTALGAWDGSSNAIVYMGESVAAGGQVTRKWRAAKSVATAGGKQFFRVRVTYP
jgi:hypothetical protein